MARPARQSAPQRHKFRDKLVLNQWLMHLLGVDPLQEHHVERRLERPWKALSAPIRDPRLEGLNESGLHRFYQELIDAPLFHMARVDKLSLLRYEENIVRHTQHINDKRPLPIVWKYYQWLTLLFTEIYLDRYFTDFAGLLRDLNGFVESFNNYLARQMNDGKQSFEQLYRDILSRVFHNPVGGKLTLSRIKGDSGEIALRCGQSETPFGLINVGKAAELCKHCHEHVKGVDVADSEFLVPMFNSVRESSSPVNLLVGSKKFVEGWDCWRVSTMGLMHVGKSEGAQIIQLFGRGVRLKGWQWSLKRSGHTFAPNRPRDIEELETLNVFGIEADFMQRFREFLKAEGLPGNERRHTVRIPLNVTYEFGKKLMVLRPKRKSSNGVEYDFKRDGPIPTIGATPEYIQHNTIVADWYPRIQAVASQQGIVKKQPEKQQLSEEHRALLDYDELYFALERFKREKSWHNMNITKSGIRELLADPTWYTLYAPPSTMEATGWENVRLWQQMAAELLKRYCDHYYNYSKAQFIEPRLELRELTGQDENMPEDREYQLIVDSSDEQLIKSINDLKSELVNKKDELLKVGDLQACRFSRHLYEPLFHVRKGGKIAVLPAALNESEFQFVKDLKRHCEENKAAFSKEKKEIFLLRNMSRGRGVGFFEARNFYPDFILWMLAGNKQYVTFIEPHGMLHEGPGSPKVRFHQVIKEIEARLGDPEVILNSFILSWSKHASLDWGKTREELEKQHVLFMTEDRDLYLNKMFAAILFHSESVSVTAQQIEEGTAVLFAHALLHAWNKGVDRRSFELGMILMQKDALRNRVLKLKVPQTVGNSLILPLAIGNMDEFIGELAGTNTIVVTNTDHRQILSLGKSAISRARIEQNATGRNAFSKAEESITALATLNKLECALDSFCVEGADYERTEIALAGTRN